MVLFLCDIKIFYSVNSSIQHYTSINATFIFTLHNNKTQNLQVVENNGEIESSVDKFFTSIFSLSTDLESIN